MNHRSRPYRPHSAPSPRHAARSRRQPLRPTDDAVGLPELRWTERRVDSAVPGQFRISIPLDGAPLPASSNAALTRMLDRLWVEPAVRRGATITSVVAVVGRSPGRAARDRDELTLLLTATGVQDGRPIDSPDMARQLGFALDQLAAHPADDA